METPTQDTWGEEPAETALTLDWGLVTRGPQHPDEASSVVLWVASATTMDAASNTGGADTVSVELVGEEDPLAEAPQPPRRRAANDLARPASRGALDFDAFDGWPEAVADVETPATDDADLPPLDEYRAADAIELRRPRVHWRGSLLVAAMACAALALALAVVARIHG